jgi:hypothetical protein
MAGRYFIRPLIDISCRFYNGYMSWVLGLCPGFSVGRIKNHPIGDSLTPVITQLIGRTGCGGLRMCA